MKKKVLIFIEDGSFSYDSRVIREATALVEAGWNVTVISPKYSADPFYKRISDKLRAYYYPKPTTESFVGQIIEHSISLILGTVLTFWVFCRHGFSILHACNPMDILWVIALPYKAIGRRFVFDHHDLCPELLLSRGGGKKGSIVYKILLGLEAASFKIADVVIATNESYRQVAILRGKKDPKRVFVVRNGPDLDRFRPVPPAQDPRFDGKVLIGYIGNMNLQDGVDYLVEAARVIVLERRRSDLLFILIGGGANQQKLASKAIEVGLENNVIFTGRIPEPEMLKTLCACDICVQPDPLNPLNDKSTMNKAMEYMALRKPVVAFDLRETRVSCGDAALYASPNNIVDLADRILELVDKPRLRKELGQRGYDRVNEVLAWNHSVPNLLGAYESALGPEIIRVLGERWRQWIAIGFSWLRAMPHLLAAHGHADGEQSADSIELQHARTVEWSHSQPVRQYGDGVAHNGKMAMMILIHSDDADISENLDTILRAAVRLDGTRNMRILIVGEERSLSEFQMTVSQLGLRNVEFHSSILPDRFSSLLAEADMHVIFHRQAMDNLLVSKRTSDALAAGRPSLFVGPSNCETAVILEDSRSGLVVTPGDVEAMDEAIRTLVRSPALREDMGRNARDYYEYYFRDDKSMSHIGEILKKSCCCNGAGRDGSSNSNTAQEVLL